MKTIELQIPDGKEVKWVNNMLTLEDEQPKDITDRIKTFEDACEWCEQHDKENLVRAYKKTPESDPEITRSFVLYRIT